MGKDKPDKPKKPQPTAEEKELARQGVEKWNRYVTRYAPLEEDLVRASDRSTSGLRAGRGNADLMQEAGDDAMRSLATPNVATGLTNLGKMSAALSSAGGVNALEARVGDRDYRDKQQLSVIKTGIGQAGQQQSGLSALGRQQNALALDRYSSDYRREVEDSLADSQAINTLAQTGASMYFGNKAQKAQGNRLASIRHGGVYNNVDAKRRF